jgi:hypothetical protein
MQYSRHAFDLLQPVASVIKPNELNLAIFARIVELLRLQFIMGLPGPQEVFESITLRDLDRTPLRIFLAKKKLLVSYIEFLT